MRLKKASYFLFLTIIMIISVFSQTFLVVNIQGATNGKTTTQLIPNNNNIKKVGQYDSGGEVVGVAIQNNYAFLADQVKGLVIVDITNPANPTYVNEYQDDGESVYDVKIIDNVAFVAHGRAGLRILDVTNPLTIIEKGVINDGGIAWKVFIVNNYAYIVDRINGIEIIDITDLQNPQKIGTYSGQPFDIHIREDIAFVAAGVNKGLEIVDISDPSSPKKISEVRNEFEDTVSVAVRNDLAYISNRENGIKVINIKGLRRPKIIANYSNLENGKTWSIWIDGSFAYLANEKDGIEIIDITNFENIKSVGQFQDGGESQSFSVIAENDLIFSAEFEEGLKIYSWKTTAPLPMENDYIRIDSRTMNFNHSVGPFAAAAFLGNDTIGLNLSLFLDIGLMSPISVTVDAPTKVNAGDEVNLKIGITGENSRFWGHFEGTIKLITPLGSTDVFSLTELGIPEQVDFAAFKTFIGENLSEFTYLNPVKLFNATFLNYTVSLIMTPFFNVTGTATISAGINDSMTHYNLDWTADGEEIIVPIQIPEEVEDFYAIPLDEFQFEVNHLRVDLDNIRFDVLLYDLIPLYSFELNMSAFNITTPLVESRISWLNPNQVNNNTLLFLDGIYPLGNFIIMIYFTGGINLPPWSILLLTLGLIIAMALPWILIFASSRRKRTETDPVETINEEE
ncbi:MAG: hypothetical protein E3J70_03040 [Candidatus Heimdallarchaeota archaeon]|nr:MAG: hypothetical protein E3J70_03040 [Candidatus Heimdallarchaeota archaeon]